MLSGQRKKDYAAETAAQALETQAEVMGLDPAGSEGFVEAEVDDAVHAPESESAEPATVAA